MGVFFSDPKDKEAYYKAQAMKAKKQAAQAARAGNDGEAARLKDVSQRATEAAISNEQLIDEAEK